MNRLTIKNGNEYAIFGEATKDEILNKLGKYEDMTQSVEAQIAVINEKIEKLRSEGKIKTATFNQLLAERMTLTGMLDRVRIWVKD